MTCLSLSCNLSLTGLQLGGVNDNLATSVGEVQRPTATMLHTVDRHRDILVDYTEEFHKIQVSLGGMSSQPRLHACTSALSSSLHSFSWPTTQNLAASLTVL